MVEFIRKELAVSLLEGLENCIINGDDSTTHLDTGGSDASGTAWSAEKYEIQILKAIVDFCRQEWEKLYLSLPYSVESRITVLLD